MSNFRRVTVTVPIAVLDAADRLATRLDRSRSWVVADALRRLTTQPNTAPAVRAVSEPEAPSYVVRSGLGPQRLAQLEADLRLTPEQRVHAAEADIETAVRFHRPPRVAQVVAFTTYDDFLDWKRRSVLW